MMWKVSERSTVAGSQWIASVMMTLPGKIHTPSNTAFRLQRMDTRNDLDQDAIAALMRKSFGGLHAKHGDTPDKAVRINSDGIMAVNVHRAFSGLTPREASDPCLWAWFTMFAVPGYVRWRWPTKSPEALAGRMAGSIRRNALARLWWWAEATYDPAADESDLEARYAITRNVTDRSDLILWCGDCAFAGKREIVRSLDAIQSEKVLGSKGQQLLCRYVNRMLKTVCIDALPDENAVRTACDLAYALSKK